MKEKALDFAGKAYRFSNSWTGTIIIVLFIIFFVAQAFRIPSGSMKDSLLIGDHLFAKKFAYGVPTPHLPFLEIPLIPGTDGQYQHAGATAWGTWSITEIVESQYRPQRFHIVVADQAEAKRRFGLHGGELAGSFCT